MIKVYLKGLLRDKQRSVLPVIIVTIGVTLTVLLQCYITGVMGDMIRFNASFSTGHVKIMTRAYLQNQSQIPNDLAILGVDELMENVKSDFPDINWVERIQFGGLIDVGDENGETLTQGPGAGIAVDLISDNSGEIERLNLEKALVRGRYPEKPNEVLISEEFSEKLEVAPGGSITLIGSTMYGSMSITNFEVVGTVKFGISALDRSGIIADISGVRQALDMEDACGEILGYHADINYNDELALSITEKYNASYTDPSDEFSQKMVTLKQQNNLGSMLNMMEMFKPVIVNVFIVIMAIVLWNAGLLGGLRRYGEIGLRLAIGERKGHVYRSMISESIIIGFVGSVFGTVVGLFFAYLMQEYGLDVSGMMKDTTMIMPGVYRAQILPSSYYIGLVPGILATVIGTALSGIGIYKRKTASLFKELEA